jgi:hypothetical protein
MMRSIRRGRRKRRRRRKRRMRSGNMVLLGKRRRARKRTDRGVKLGAAKNRLLRAA